MSKTKIKFGTGGWRALIGDDFTKENICRVAQGIVELMKSENKTDKPVIIGYDRRFISENAARWVAEVLCANGIKVKTLHRSAPTPLIMFIVKHEKLHYGIEITASHNPSTERLSCGYRKCDRTLVRRRTFRRMLLLHREDRRSA